MGELPTMKAVLLVLVLCAVVPALAHISFPWSEDPPNPDTGACLTTWLWEQKVKHYGNEALRSVPSVNKAGCKTQGKCDDPFVRAQTPSKILKLNFLVHVMAASNGTWPSSLTEQNVKDMMTTVAKDWENGMFSFQYEIVEHRNDDYFCIPQFSPIGNWHTYIDGMKEDYAQNPETTINIFVSCQTPGPFGTLLGIATFPWDKSALNKTGGLWINSVTPTPSYQSKGDKTLMHELGHNLGLWHTFHGVNEVVKCGPCYENYHSISDFEANYVGDFCADTLSTPQNFYCEPPGGVDCNGTSWGVTDYKNYMGYSQSPPPGCQSHFTDNQISRSHCWVCDAIPSQVMNPEEC